MYTVAEGTLFIMVHRTVVMNVGLVGMSIRPSYVLLRNRMTLVEL